MTTKYKVINESNDHKYFTIVPNLILNHSTAIEQALYFQMKRAAGEGGKCFMTQETYCDKLGIGIKRLRRALNYLLKNDWIKYIGTTPSKTRPIKTYKVNDIWRKNVEFYEAKKIPAKRTISFQQKKDTSQKNSKIQVKSGSIRRFNTKEDNTSGEANASGLSSLRKILEKKKILTPKPQRGATYQWQDTAVRWWKKLGLVGSPATSWFKHFRDSTSLMERACSWASDSGANNLEKLVYWALNQFKKNGKIVYDKQKIAAQF